MVLPTISDCPPTTHSQTPVFLSFYNLVLLSVSLSLSFLLSALMNTLQSPVMEHRPELGSFPSSNKIQSSTIKPNKLGESRDTKSYDYF